MDRFVASRTMSRREAILARAAALAESSSDDADASTRDVDGVRPLGRRRTFVPLEELTRERKDAPFRPPGDRRAAARAADDGARGTAAPARAPATAPSTPNAVDAEAWAKEDAKLLMHLPESERPMVTQAFSMRAPAKVPRAVRQRFLNALAARKLRSRANVGVRERVSEAWISAHPDERKSAGEEAVKEEMKLHAKATSKATYRNLSAQLMLRGGESAKAEPGALKQDYECSAANDIDLTRCSTVRGDEAVEFFIAACKHRDGSAHRAANVDEVKVEVGGEEDVDAEESEALDEACDAATRIDEPINEVAGKKITHSAVEVAVRKLCCDYVQLLVDTGACEAALASIVEQKVVKKVMMRHQNDRDDSFLIKESASIRKLVASQLKHENARRATT